jgi:glycosyltransferase involved in cell wall biosynthesis
LRILHIIAGAEFGGAETIAQDVVAALGEAGHEQRVIGRPYPIATARFAAARVPFTGFGFSPLDRLRGGGASIRRQAEAFKADIVQGWMSRAASFIPESMPCPVAGWFGDYYDLKYFRHVDFYIGLTRRITDYLVKEGAPGERVFLVHTFGTLRDEPPADRAALDTPAGAPLALMLSRLHKIKGIDTMLRALTLCPGVYLWLGGEGPERENLIRLRDELGLADRVRFLGWRTDRAALFQAADLFALPSRYEPFGAVIAEAWYMGTPLIATRADGAAAYVSDGVDGLLCPIDDPPALAACINRLVADPELRARLSRNGRLTYERQFSKPVVIESLVKAYETMRRLGPRARK